MDVPLPARAPAAPRTGQLWQAGTLLGGRYRLAGKIGAGAMGEVWRAEHVALGTTVAMKLVDTRGQEDGQMLLARFQLEARSAAQLKSPHVVQILDHGVDGAVAFIAMELLEGEGLEQRLERRHTLQPAEVAHLLREMARGVERAHAAGLIHRDLKPPNVFLARQDGREIVKVLDFGIAKMLGTPRDAHLQTQQGFVVGTPAYMSPEQVLGKELGVASDLWQMGLIAFECLTGRRPFDGETLGQLFLNICSSPLPVPSTVARVPPGFDAWFARAADRNPALRFRSATELAESLAAVLAPGGVGEAAIATLTSAKRGAALPPKGTDPAAIHGAGIGATGKVAAWSAGAAERPRSSAALLFVGLPVVAAALGVGVFWGLHRGGAPRDVDAAGPSAAPIVAPATVGAATVAAATTPIAVEAPAPAPSASAPAPSASAAAPLVSAKIKPRGPRPAPGNGDPDFGF